MKSKYDILSFYKYILSYMMARLRRNSQFFLAGNTRSDGSEMFMEVSNR